MPIRFPIPLRGNPFNRWNWQRGAVPPVQKAPNLAHPGLPFTASTLAPGFWRPRTIAANTRDLGRMYRHGERTGAYPNPAAALKTARVTTGIVRYERVLGSLVMRLSGITRDNVGAPLGNCIVEVFRIVEGVRAAVTTSDGAGAWSVYLMVGPYFVIGYLAGSPNRAGVTDITLEPVPVVT